MKEEEVVAARPNYSKMTLPELREAASRLVAAGGGGGGAGQMNVGKMKKGQLLQLLRDPILDKNIDGNTILG